MSFFFFVGMPKGGLKKNRALANLHKHHVVYGVLIDFRMSRAQDVMSFYHNVLQSNETVLDVLWITLPLIPFFRREDDDVRHFHAADAFTKEHLRRIMAKWKAHPLGPDPDKRYPGETKKRYAALKLIVFPNHGAKQGQPEEGCLLWSCEGSTQDDYIPQRLPVLLHQAASMEFNFVVLNYCYSGSFVTSIPSAISEDVDLVRFSNVQSLQVVSFLGVRYSGTDPTMGRSHIESYLRLGAPIGDKNKKVKKGLVVVAKLTVRSAQVGRGGRALPILSGPYGFKVLGGDTSDSEPDQDEELNTNLEESRDAKDRVWLETVTQMSKRQIREICARLRKGNHVKVAWQDFEGSDVVHAKHGWVAQEGDVNGDGVLVCYLKKENGEGEWYMEPLPPLGNTFIMAVEVVHGA